MKKGNIIIASIFAVLAFFIIFMARMLPVATDGVPGPGFWPILIAIIMLLSSISVIIQTIKTKSQNEKQIVFLSKDTIRVYITMGGLILYLILMGTLGFLTSTLIMTFCFITWFGSYKIYINLILSIAISGIIYAIFKFILKVPFSFGMLI